MRLQKAGEIGFAGRRVRHCEIHGDVLWCACMRTSAQRRADEIAEARIVGTLLGILFRDLEEKAARR